MDIKGYKVLGKKKRDHWASICEEWLLLIERYVRVEEDADASYLYNEMADVAVLAGAAWRTGFVGLTETQIEKGVKYRPKHWGRADLYIANEKIGEFVEAKHRKFTLRARDIEGVFREGSEKAYEDARSTSGSAEYFTTGICFFSAKFPESQLKESDDALEAAIENAIETAKSLNPHIMAWCFPERSRKLDRGDGYRWPGTIMLGFNPDYVTKNFWKR